MKIEDNTTAPVAMLGTALSSHGVTVRDAEGDAIVVERGRTKANLEIRNRSLQDSVERILETLVLHALRQQRSPDSRILVISVPNLPLHPERLTEEYDRLVEYRKGSKVRWAIISERGGSVIHLDGILPKRVIEQDMPALRGPALAAGALAFANPQRSDLTLTLLKLLLADRSPTHDAWFGPGFIRPTSANDLATRFGVSVSAIYAAIGAIRHRRWMDPRRGSELRLTEAGPVITWWMDHAKNNPAKRIAVRDMFAKRTTSMPGTLAWLRKRPKVTACQWMVNGWGAIELHGASHLNTLATKPVSLVLRGPLPALLKMWDLVPSDSASDPRTILHIETATCPRSVFIGGNVLDGLPCIDLFQAALDVVSDPDRGVEQSTAITESLFPVGS